MKPRKHKALSLRVIRLLNGWKDPHSDLPYTKTEAMRSIEIGETGIVAMRITPHRPHFVDGTAEAAVTEIHIKEE